MQRAGCEGTPVFLIGGKSNVLAEKPSRSCESSRMLTWWGRQDGYFKLEQRETLFERVHASGGRPSSS